MKQLLSFLILFCWLNIMAQQSPVSPDDNSPTLSYVYDNNNMCGVYDRKSDDGTCWICSPSDDSTRNVPSYSGSIKIPEYIAGRRVVGIKKSAFNGNALVTDLTISGTVMITDKDAFAGCTGLKVLSILPSAEKLDVQYSYTQAGAFNDLRLDSLYIERDLKFDYSPFSYYASANVVKIGPSIESFGQNIFAELTIGKIDIPANVKTFGTNSFYWAKITELNIESSNEYLDLGLYFDSRGSKNKPFSNIAITKIHIDRPISTTDLGCYKDAIREVTLGKNASNIDFSYSWVEVADVAMEEIAAQTFAGCSKLESLTLHDGIKTIGAKAFFECASLKHLALPESLISIGANAFNGLANLEEITLPESWKNDTPNDFNTGSILANCKNLKRVNNLNVKCVPPRMFSNCTSLENMEFGENVEHLGDYCFENCTGLRTLSVPGTADFGRYIFNGCVNLESLIFEDGDPLFLYSTIFSTPIKYVYFGRQFSYTPNNWKYMDGCLLTPFGNLVAETAEFGPMVEEIYDYFLNGSATLSHVIIGPGVKRIKMRAFYDCINLAEIIIPSNVEDIASSAFANCTGLETVIFETSGSAMSRAISEATTVNTDAFKNCTNITKVQINGNAIPDLQDNVFHSNVYKNATLLVPIGMKETYAAHPKWSQFNQITEDTLSLIECPDSQNETPAYVLNGNKLVTTRNVQVYSVDGTSINNNAIGDYHLTPGIYIIVDGSKTSKLLIK